MKYSVVEIYSGDNSLGPGLLITDKHVLTCYHVVEKYEGEKISVLFPLLEPKFKEDKIPAILYKKRTEDKIDLAILELTGDISCLPAIPARFSANINLDGKFFECFGYPEKVTGGTLAKGIISKPQGFEWIEVVGRNDYVGYFIKPGFSGCGVYNPVCNLFYGIVNAGARDKDVKVACFIPITTIIEKFPEFDGKIKITREIDRIIKLLKEEPESTFKRLSKIFIEDNSNFREILKRYPYSGKGDISHDLFRELVGFIEQHEQPLADFRFEDTDYELLCEFNFTRQSSCFFDVTQREQGFLSFVIRGTEEDYGQKWLLNKLIYSYNKKKRIHAPFILDFLETNMTLPLFLRRLAKYLSPERRDGQMTNLELLVLISQKIVTATQFFVLKNAYQFLHSEEYPAFLDLLSFFSSGLIKINGGYKCIFIFVEEKINEPYLYPDHCFFSEGHIDNSEAINRAREFCLIDLGQITPITQADRNNWVNKYYEDIKRISGRTDELTITFNGDNPQLLIPEICQQIGLNYIENEKLWLKY